MRGFVKVRHLKYENVSCVLCIFLAFFSPIYIFITKKSQKVID